MFHGNLCSCVGPIIDAEMLTKVFSVEKFMYIHAQRWVNIQRDVFLPSLYDALIVLRPNIHFRHGSGIRFADTLLYVVCVQRSPGFFLRGGHWALPHDYLDQLGTNDSYFCGLYHLIPGRYQLNCVSKVSELAWALS